jgi:hypothetical protein
MRNRKMEKNRTKKRNTLKIHTPSGTLILFSVIVFTLAVGVGGYYFFSPAFFPELSGSMGTTSVIPLIVNSGSNSSLNPSPNFVHRVLLKKKTKKPSIITLSPSQVSVNIPPSSVKGSKQLNQMEIMLNTLAKILSEFPTTTQSFPRTVKRKATVSHPYFATTTVVVRPSPEVYSTLNSTQYQNQNQDQNQAQNQDQSQNQTLPISSDGNVQISPESPLAISTEKMISIQPGFGQGAAPTIQPIQPTQSTGDTDTIIIDVPDPNLPSDYFDPNAPDTSSSNIPSSTIPDSTNPNPTDQGITQTDSQDSTLNSLDPLNPLPSPVDSQSPLPIQLPAASPVPTVVVAPTKPVVSGTLNKTQKVKKKRATKTTLKKIIKKHTATKAKKKASPSPSPSSSPVSVSPPTDSGSSGTPISKPKKHKTIVHRVPKNSNSVATGSVNGVPSSNGIGAGGNAPVDSSLSVVINEIMWGGSVANASDEWIELYNQTNHDIDLSHITLESADGTPNIPLRGHIGPRKYYLIKRTAETLPDVTANLTAPFSGLKKGNGLDNKGEVLSLVSLVNNNRIILDSTPALSACKNKWCAGTAKPSHRSMERVCANVAGNLPSNWKSNNMSVRNGHDRNGNAINGTPGVRNSVAQGNL